LQNAQTAFHARPDILIQLLTTCTEKELSLATVIPNLISSKIYHAYFRIDRDEQLIRYLLRSTRIGQVAEVGTTRQPILAPSEQLNGHLAERAVLEMLLAKLKGFRDSWLVVVGERASNVSPDMVYIIASLCVVTKVFLGRINGSHSTNGREAGRLTEQVWEMVSNFVSRQETDAGHSLLNSMASALLAPQAKDILERRSVQQSLSTLCAPVLDILRTTFDSQGADAVVQQDSIDPENSFMSEASQNVTESHSDGSVREELPFSCDERSALVRMTVELFLNQALASEQHEFDPATNSTVVDFFVSLSPAHLLAARRPIVDFLSETSSLTRNDALRVLEKLAAGCMQDDNFERCEASLCLCLDAMTALASLWASDDEDDLRAAASDMYVWFLEIALGRALASSNVLKGIARMLEAVLETNALFHRNTSLRSPRTSLFEILRAGDNSVKYHVARRICRIFDRFVLTEHEAILDDVVESLPSDPENIEGIAVRLSVLADLAAKWNTLLRRSMYHVFETAAQVPQSVPYAQVCLRKLCQALRLSSPREIFLLFCPQILYTWLEKEPIDSIPFAIYGFESLTQLLSAAQLELVGQIAMRGSTEQAKILAQKLDAPWEDMLRASFAKAEAYTIARDISMPPRENSAKSTESLLRKQLGNESYITLVGDLFPDIAATLFVTLGEEHGIERAFSKRQGFNSAKATLSAITDLSHSEVGLPVGQQPTFRAKFLLDELDFLCQRIDLDLESIWDSALVIHICRTLLDSAVPALGSLYACAVLRKLRIVVSMARSTALKGYPIEMLLHAVRPYLIIFHCSEDALGLFWFLLDQGKAYLQTRPSFMIGLAVATFISLTKFLNSSQESTTQESHFRATMSKAQSFHIWFGKYLDSFQPLSLGQHELDAFQRFVHAARGVTKLGSTIKGSHEGDLMLELFDDRTSKRQLLSEASFTLALELACSGFESPAKPREDIFGDDATACLHAPVIWDIILHITVGSEFRTWAAQTLGRAYAATGIASDKLSRERNVTHFQSAGDELRPGSNSDNAILHRLQAMLFTNDRVAAGQAERTLQMIITQLHANGTIGLYDSDVDAILAKDLQWSLFPCPSPIIMPAPSKVFPQWDSELRPEEWASQIALALCLEMRQDPILWALRHVLSEQPHFAEQVLPAVVHKVLLSESDSQRRIRQILSDIFNDILKHHGTISYHQVGLVNGILLYLRCQPFPKECTMADRSSWLEIDLGLAAAAAATCQAHKTAILFLELQDSQRHLQSARSSRRSSAPRTDDLGVLLQSVFQKLDDPDFFYGVQEQASIESVLRKLDHEGAGLQKLSFQSAMYDSKLKCSTEQNETPDASGVMSALSSANLDGLARAVQLHQKLNDDEATTDSVLSTGLNLHQWDLPALPSLAPSTKGAFMTFRQLNISRNQPKILSILNQGLLESMNQIGKAKTLDSRVHQAMSTLTILTEVKETLASSSIADLNDQWQTMTARTKWMKFESFERSRPIILGREALFSAIRRNDYLQSILKINASDSQLFEVKVVRDSLRVAGHHDASQSALNRAMYLSDLAILPTNSGLKIESIAQYDLAKILWDQGQTTTSIQMLRQLKDRDDLRQGAFAVSRSEILADLGQRTAEARLNKPDEIIAQCLVPAIKELNGRSQGSEAGRVFHDFAAFCDLQLQNPDDKDDFHRIETIRHRKEKEVLDLQRMIKKADRKVRAQLEQHQTSAERWFKLDDEEYRRLQSARENLVQQSLENYLLSLRACDDYKNDVLRFCALWLDQSQSEQANIAVGRHISKVASRKFAPLMSQLASRLLDEEVDFQLLLSELLWRICCDHPYHGMYQVFVGSKTRGARNDEIAASRSAAASKLAKRLIDQPSVSKIWIAIHNSSIAFVHCAQERLEEKKHKAGAKASLQELKTGLKLVQAIEQSSTKIPPPTMKIPLRSDCKYSSIPTFSKFEPFFSIAGGVSAPKIITIIGTDGQRYKMLLKGGNDDLRQDSIMEQVFEQVSNLLQDHRATRQRQLGIRTYKVLPLTQNAGIIEFVKDTIPLHEYSLPAHQRYFPKDYKPNRCRKEISDAQTKPLPQRLQAYRNVTNNFHPVLRFFLMERFLNPDDWFSKRLAYSRSTAAISILGYVLGLGDRHGHNILLDEQTGEVVHIDLGVAFEAGRVLPVPETVPFRLTRDIVDGMGLSGVEGVFRRCCNFTLEALRQDQYSIMTILDVLRYDPLYSWSVSPLRLQRMQENQGLGDGDPTATGTLGKNRDTNEPSEADRALTVVGKKLGKSLSVEATVNELIQQATDERNLATLYCGWSAYA
jgi:ataxia telangiectasia mutated family protein